VSHAIPKSTASGKYPEGGFDVEVVVELVFNPFLLMEEKQVRVG
jgi:hypothetical protein